MPRKYKLGNQKKVYFVTFTVIHNLDVFVRQEYRDILLESLRYCQKNRGMQLFAYCVMTSHVDLIVANSGDERLDGIIRDIKKYTANRLIDAIRNNPQESKRELLMWFFERDGRGNPNNTNYQFWEQHSRSVELTTDEMIEQWMGYIHNNPVEAGFVLSPERYLYSSAVNYAGLPERLLEVVLL